MARARPKAYVPPQPPVVVGTHDTRPIDSSPYPLSLVPRGQDPDQANVRFMGGIMVVLILATYMIVVPVINQGVIYLGFTADRATDWTAYLAAASSFSNVWGILASHLGLSAMILVVWAYFHRLNRRRMAWMWSVSPGVRWRYGFLCLAASLIIVGAVTVYHWVVGTGWNPPSGWGWYVLVIVVTTPFQALAEEVMFRGYLMQAFGAIVRNVWFPIVCTSVVFALFHGLQNPWLFSSRLVFGILAGILVWKTGGLEAGVAIHIANNLCAFGLALFMGTLSEVRTTTSVNWTQSFADVAMFAVCAVVCWLMARKMRVPTLVPSR